jgi:hypothetical protein
MPARGLVRLLAVALAFASTASIASAASPRLNVIQPRGVQRGVETVVTFSGGQLGDAEEIFFYEPGVSVTKIEAADINNAKVTLKVAPDCRLGEHTAQVRTKTGISDYRTFFVGALPVIAEKEPNTDFAAPQPIAMNVTVHGVVDNEDVDYFVVEAKKGDRISAEVEGIRLGLTLFDPYVAIMDEKRFELAAADDTALLLQDPCTSVVAPADGKYIIQIRESSYGGNGGCQYRLHIGNFPRPLAVYPAGGQIGQEVEVKFLGDPSGDIVQKVKLPAQVSENYGVFAEQNGHVAASENAFRLYEHGNALEVEPNNELAQATPAQLPNAFNGILEAAGDVDHFKFAAKKGEVYEVECFGRRIRSPIDPVMLLMNAQGAGITSNDDSRGPDSYFRFQVPADGEYVLQIKDHLGRGGKDFVYRVEFQTIKQTLTLGIPRTERYGQFRQQIYVAQGNRFGAVLTAGRGNFGGDLILDGKDLPAGMTMVAEPMPAGLSSMPVVFEVTEDAPLSGKLLDFTAHHADPNVKISGGFNNRADFIIAAPGQSLYRWKDVDRLPIAVIEELPFKIDIVEPKVPLAQNGSMQLKIVATRDAGFTKPITVQLPFLPPGVGSAPSVTIPEGQNEVLYPLNANSGAPPKKWRLFALASAEVTPQPEGEKPQRRRRRGGGPGTGWCSSQLATIEISEPFVQFALDRGSVEQAKGTDIVCKVTVTKPFEGAAKVQLIGLPNKVTTPEIELTKDKTELVFKIQTDATSPPGVHKNLFCQIVIPMNGEQVVHTAGNTELRIDKPLPPPVNAPPKPMPVAAATPAPAAPMPMAEKRLTRLEKLRLETKETAPGGK